MAYQIQNTTTRKVIEGKMATVAAFKAYEYQGNGTAMVCETQVTEDAAEVAGWVAKLNAGEPCPEAKVGMFSDD